MTPGRQPILRKATRMYKTRILLSAAALAAGLAITGTAVAGQAATQQTCFDSTVHTTLDTTAITAGLGLSYELTQAVRARLSTYNSVRGFQGLDGLGLTASQEATMNTRIAAQTSGGHPLGWPCAPFKNRARVTSYVRARLVGSGFAPGMTFYPKSTRQVQLKAVNAGVQYYGVIVKSGARQVKLLLDKPGWARTYVFNLSFDA